MAQSQEITTSPDLPQDIWEHIRKAVASLKFGTVEVTVHDGKIVQVERKEKLRFNQR